MSVTMYLFIGLFLSCYGLAFNDSEVLGFLPVGFKGQVLPKAAGPNIDTCFFTLIEFLGDRLLGGGLGLGFDFDRGVGRNAYC